MDCLLTITDIEDDLLLAHIDQHRLDLKILQLPRRPEARHHHSCGNWNALSETIASFAAQTRCTPARGFSPSLRLSSQTMLCIGA